MMNQETIPPEDIRLAQLVRGTLHTATQPAPGQLNELMPPVPQRGKPPRIWPRQWAALAATLLLILGSLGAFFAQQQSWLAPVTPTHLAITATYTNTPASTVAEVEAKHSLLPRQTIPAAPAEQPMMMATPAPNPTPTFILSN